MGIPLYWLELKLRSYSHTSAMKHLLRWAPVAVGCGLFDWKTWNERQPKAARLQQEEDSSWHGLIVSPVMHGLLRPREPLVDFPQPSIKTKRNPLWVTLHLSASHPLLLLLFHLKRPPLTQQWKKEDPLFSSLFPHTCHCLCLQKATWWWGDCCLSFV